MEERHGIKVNPVVLIIISVAILLLVLITFSLGRLFESNPFGAQIKIDNFSEYFDDTPKEIRDSLFAALYDMAERNLDESIEIPISGALIRQDSTSYLYDEKKNMNYGNFVVDIEVLGQSYHGYFEWSNDSNNAYYSGYRTLYTCLPSTDLIYGEFGCVDMFEKTAAEIFPIIQVLPVMVDYYENNYTVYTKYYITYDIVGDNESIVLEIDDYTGGNYDKAIAKIRELGYDPDDYEITYSDISSEYTSVYVGD